MKTLAPSPLLLPLLAIACGQSAAEPSTADRLIDRNSGVQSGPESCAEEMCTAEFDRCVSSNECVALFSCADLCNVDDDGCFDACIEAAPTAAVQQADALASCIVARCAEPESEPRDEPGVPANFPQLVDGARSRAVWNQDGRPVDASGPEGFARYAACPDGAIRFGALQLCVEDEVGPSRYDIMSYDADGRSYFTNKGKIVVEGKNDYFIWGTFEGDVCDTWTCLYIREGRFAAAIGK